MEGLAFPAEGAEADAQFQGEEENEEVLNNNDDLFQRGKNFKMLLVDLSNSWSLGLWVNKKTAKQWRSSTSKKHGKKNIPTADDQSLDVRRESSRHRPPPSQCLSKAKHMYRCFRKTTTEK